MHQSMIEKQQRRGTTPAALVRSIKQAIFN
jgi:hypothetical protein